MALLKQFSVKSTAHNEMIEITETVQSIVTQSGVRFGTCMVYVPHTTAAITINENADPDVVHDILMEMDKLVPASDGYRHVEANSAAHIKSSLFGAYEMVIIEDQRLLLGMWQGIYFCEFDGPRSRKVYVKLMEG